MNNTENELSRRSIPASEDEEQSSEGLATSTSDSITSYATEKDISKPINPLAILELLRDAPQEKIDAIVEGTIKISESTSLPLISVKAETELRQTGIWIGAGMTTLCLAGGVAVLLSSAPALIGAALFIVGTASAGATYALISGARVTTEDFARLLTAAKRALTVEERDEDDK